MEDYPRDLVEFEAWFATEEACRDYLFRLRWPDGFRCPPVRLTWHQLYRQFGAAPARAGDKHPVDLFRCYHDAALSQPAYH